MRNLKRVLSLTLASVMLLGMMVIGSSAAEVTKKDFTDAGDIEYTEAVDVMVALGVIEGTPNGDFDPKGTLTREAAAKIICYMLLGEENAEKLTANKAVFTDVAANRWSAGYISYCTERNILAGTGNGSFNPTGELTGVAFGKMLLVALGYDPDIQGYTGSGWALSVAADMVDAKIAPAGVLLNDAMTREQAAQTAFQTLEADMVRYANKGTTIQQENGRDIIVGFTPATPVSNTTSDYTQPGGNYVPNTSSNATQQFCERYFPRLLKIAGQSDNYGRPGSNWTYKGSKIAFDEDGATFTYTAKTSESNVSRDLRSYDLASSHDVFVNGVKNNSLVTAKTTSGVTGGIEDLTANGREVTIYTDNNGDIKTIAAIDTFLGKVTRVSTSSGVTTTSVQALTGVPGATSYETDNFQRDDMVLFTVGSSDGTAAKREVASMVAAEATVTGEITATSTDYLRLDGTRYDKAGLYTVKDSKTLNPGDDAMFYTDAYGYILYVDEVQGAATQYMYVKGADKYFDTISVRAVFADGTTDIVTLDGDTRISITTSGQTTTATVVENGGTKVSDMSDANLSVSAPQLSGNVYAYTESDGVYKLTPSNASIQTSNTSTRYNIEKNRATLYLTQTGTTSNGVTTWTDGSRSTLNVTNSTVYVKVSDGSTWTGYRNVPSMNGVSMIYVVDDGIVDLVFITGSEDGDSENAFFFYITDAGKGESFRENGSNWVRWSDEVAYVDGVGQEVVTNTDVKDDITGAGLYKATRMNDNNYVTAVEGGGPVKTLNTIKNTDKVQTTFYQDGTLRLDKANAGSGNLAASSYRYDDDTNFIYVDADGNPSASSAIIIKDSGLPQGSDITYIYVAEVKGSSGTDANIAKTVYIVAATKDTPAAPEVQVPSNTPNATELQTAIQNTSGSVVSLPSNVKVPADTVVPGTKTLVVTDDNISGNSLSVASGKVDATNMDTAGKTITVGAHADVTVGEIKAGADVTITAGGKLNIEGPQNEIVKVTGNATDEQVKNLGTGAYVLTNSSDPTEDQDVNGGISSNRFFVFETAGDTQTAVLVIDNAETYREEHEFASAGEHYFYIQVTGAGINNAGTGTLSGSAETAGTALTAGPHNWTVTLADGTRLAGGSFTIPAAS